MFVSQGIRLKFYTHPEGDPGRLCSEFQTARTGDGRVTAVRPPPGQPQPLGVGVISGIA